MYLITRQLEECEIEKIDLQKQLEDIAVAIHYPDCWDTMAYPTLLSAITEIHLCTTCLAKDQRVKESDDG